MSQLTHRARERLIRHTEQYRPAWDLAMQWHMERRGEWPEWCYLPMAGWDAATDVLYHRRDPMNIDDVAVATLGTWRLTQGIYRIDPDVYAALLETPVDGNIPVDILYRLPQWCVYIETPNMGMMGEAVHGFWAQLSYNASASHSLAIVLDIDSMLHPYSLTLEGGTIEDAMNRLMDISAGAQPALTAMLQNMSNFAELRQGYIDVLRKLLPLVMYLCTPESMPQRPSNPPVQRTKRGPRLFPASTPTTWDVGVRMGSALRAAYAAENGGEHQGGTVRGHIRRAHWHGFRSGPMKTPDGQAIPAEKRRFELRWMPPIAVNLPDIEQLPATIYPVK